MRARQWMRTALVSLVVAAPLLLMSDAGAQAGGVGAAVVPEFPGQTTVGETFTAGLFIENRSTDPVTLTVTDITLTPACGTSMFLGCPAPFIDPGVFDLDPVATGQPGTACAGMTFAVAETSPGVFTFTAIGPPVVLAPGQACRILFTATTLRTPTMDSAPAIPGVQTTQVAQALFIPTDPAIPPFLSAGVDITLVNPAVPLIATQADPQVVDVGGPFTDTAIVTGPAAGPTPTGTVVFRLFGPSTPGFPTCVGAPIRTTAPAPLQPTGPNTAQASSGAFGVGPDALPPGNYVIVAEYSGDANFLPVTSACNDPAEQVTINALPTILVDKTADPLTMQEPGGTFTFNVLVTNTSAEPLTITSLTDDVYGNLNGRGTCAIGAVLAPGGTYACSFQGAFTGLAPAAQTDTVTVIGADADGNEATDDDDATVALIAAPPTILVDKTANPLSLPEPGGDFTFTVVVTNTTPRSVTITTLRDDIYGDLAARPGTCAAAIGTVLAATPGPGNTFTCSFTGPFTGPAGAQQTDIVTAIAIDQFGNQATDADDAVVTITDVPPVIRVDKTASPLSRPEPGGTFTFNVVVTNTSFEPVTITTLTDDIYGNLVGRGNCNVGAVLPPNGGTYSCSFPGEFTGVGGASQTDVVTVTGVDDDGTTVTDTDDATVTLTGGGVLALPVLRVDKTAAPTSRPAPGGTFTFNVVVTNPGTVAVTIRTLTDDVYGDVTRIPGSTCNTAIGTVLAPGGTYTCAFQGDFRGPGNSQTDVVTVTGTDNQGNIARASDDAVVTITPPPPGVPSIATTKVASPGSLPEPGGLFTFTHTVVNNGPEPVRITSLVDNVYGDLNGKGSCTVGARLAVGASYTCSFPGNFFGNAGAAQTDVITTTAVDDRGQTVTSRADAIVRITDVPPTVTVVKSADPVSRPEPGGTFRFTVTVTNTSFEPVTIRSLVDDIYGDLNGRGSCSVGIRLAARGGSYSCAFDGDFRGRSGDSQTDIVTVVAVDDDNTPATDRDRATVTLTPPGTPPVSPPPPPPPAPPAPQAPQRPLVRTGSDLTGPARLAGLLLLVGMTLVAATRRFGEGGPGLVPVPAGPGGGPRRPRGPGSGPRGFGNDSWFGGAPVAPPPGPLGGLGAGVVEAPPAPPAAEPAAEPDSGHGFGNDSWFSGPQAQPPQGPLGGLGSDLVAAPPAPPAAEPNSEPAWDEWVGVRAPAETVASKVDPVEAPTAAAPVAETPVAEMLVAEPVAVEPVAVEPVALESVAYEPVVDTRVADQAVRAIAGPTGDAATTVAGADGLVPEVVVPTVVQVRSTNALDGAALDAAQALSAPARTAAPPAARRRGRKLGRS